MKVNHHDNLSLINKLKRILFLDNISNSTLLFVRLIRKFNILSLSIYQMLRLIIWILRLRIFWYWISIVWLINGRIICPLHYVCNFKNKQILKCHLQSLFKTKFCNSLINNFSWKNPSKLIKFSILLIKERKRLLTKLAKKVMRSSK